MTPFAPTGMVKDVDYRFTDLELRYYPTEKDLDELIEALGAAIGGWIAAISDAIKDIIIDWLESLMPKPHEVRGPMDEYQRFLTKALLPDDVSLLAGDYIQSKGEGALKTYYLESKEIAESIIDAFIPDFPFDDVIYRLLIEIVRVAGPEIGKDLAEIAKKLNEVIRAWLDRFTGSPHEVRLGPIEFQANLTKALLPDDSMINNLLPPAEELEKGLFGTTETDTVEKSHLAEGRPIENKINGEMREETFRQRLEREFPVEQGYIIEDEVYLRNDGGNIVKDDITGEARRVDFVVIKDGKVVKSYEVTSLTAPKEEQMAKEGRIRENGGNCMKNIDTGEIIPFENTKTEVVRLA